MNIGDVFKRENEDGSFTYFQVLNVMSWGVHSASISEEEYYQLGGE